MQRMKTLALLPHGKYTSHLCLHLQRKWSLNMITTFWFKMTKYFTKSLLRITFNNMLKTGLQKHFCFSDETPLKWNTFHKLWSHWMYFSKHLNAFQASLCDWFSNSFVTWMEIAFYCFVFCMVNFWNCKMNTVNYHENEYDFLNIYILKRDTAVLQLLISMWC